MHAPLVSGLLRRWGSSSLHGSGHREAFCAFVSPHNEVDVGGVGACQHTTREWGSQPTLRDDGERRQARLAGPTRGSWGGLVPARSTNQQTNERTWTAGARARGRGQQRRPRGGGARHDGPVGPRRAGRARLPRARGEGPGARHEAARRAGAVLAVAHVVEAGVVVAAAKEKGRRKGQGREQRAGKRAGVF